MSQKAAAESAEELSESIWSAPRNGMTLSRGSKAGATARDRSKSWIGADLAARVEFQD